MKASQLLKDIEFTLVNADGSAITDEAEIAELLEKDIANITNDSRKIVPGGLFFCIEGANSDGHNYAAATVAAGAAALVICKPVEVMIPEGQKAPLFIMTKNTRHAMAMISAAYFEYPSRQLKMIGVTGTKGKTTTTYLIKSILEHAGVDTGLIGTIESTYHDVHRAAHNTTPESLALQTTLREMADAGVQAVVMEVSSQALMMGRTDGVEYDIGVFTNLSPDHIGPNEHSSFEEYAYCKSLLFKQCKTGIVNGDDPHLEDILKGHTCDIETFGLSSGNDLYADELELVKDGGELGIRFKAEGLLSFNAYVPTPGRFSVYNALCAIAVCRHFSVDTDRICAALKEAKVRGRIEMVKVSDDFTLMIDYAHNAVALESLLSTLKEYEPGRLVSVFGCGGNRSKLRRFEMGEVSGKLADLTIITSDNPRFEEPMEIIADIITGISRTDGQYTVVPDRKEAIAYAIHNGQPGDIIVLAGKGHEDYQEIKGKKYPMDERDLIADILKRDSIG